MFHNAAEALYAGRVARRWLEAGETLATADRLAREQLEEVRCACRNLCRQQQREAMLRDLAAWRARQRLWLRHLTQTAEALLWVGLAVWVGWLMGR